jgi:flagellar protein FlbD
VITVRKINNKELVVNCELIKTIEGESDTVISLVTGEKLVVADRPHEIVRKVIEYRKSINSAGIGLYVRPKEEEMDESETVEE